MYIQVKHKFSMRIVILSIYFLISLNTHAMSQSYQMPEIPQSNNDGFIVIAHRGASAYAPENTHSAFRMAIDMQAEMIELDVSISKDGVPVVIHDDTIDRTTGSKGQVMDYTLAELKELETGSWFRDEFDGEPFPTLEEVLEYTKDKIAVNIEIKSEAVSDELEGGVVQKSLKLVLKAGVQDQVIFSSFDYRVLTQLEELNPDIPKAMLYEKSQSGRKLPSELVKEYKVDAFNCSHRELSRKWVEDLNEHQIPFLVYTVNDEKRMKEVIEMGAKGIFSDKPDLLKEVVEKL